jgi:hypothetical protein
MRDLEGVQQNAEMDTEVVGVAKRRVFSPAYKRRILEEADRARPGEIGLILRREGAILFTLGRMAESEEWHGLEEEDSRRSGGRC